MSASLGRREGRLVQAGLPKRILSAKGERAPAVARRTLDEVQTPAHVGKGGERLIQVFASMRRRNLAADPRCSLRDDGIPKAGDEVSLLQQELAHGNGGGSLRHRLRV